MIGINKRPLSGCNHTSGLKWKWILNPHLLPVGQWHVLQARTAGWGPIAVLHEDWFTGRVCAISLLGKTWALPEAAQVYCPFPFLRGVHRPGIDHGELWHVLTGWVVLAVHLCGISPVTFMSYPQFTKRDAHPSVPCWYGVVIRTPEAAKGIRGFQTRRGLKMNMI